MNRFPVKYPMSFDTELWRRIQAEAFEKKMTAAAFIRDKLRTYFKNKDGRKKVTK